MLNVILARPAHHRALTVFPLVTADAVELPYQLLAEALGADRLRITEVGSGTVPQLLAVNSSDAAVLVLDGEQLIGARQNRMTNRSILLPAKSETLIPVACMEQGRWHFVSDHFSPTPQHSPSNVRRKAREVEAGYAARGSAVPQEALSEAQHEVWSTIADNAARQGARSETGAMDQLFEARAADVEKWAVSFSPVEGQIGLLAFLGARPLGMDVIGGRELYRKLHDRLVRGYVMDALGSRGGREPALDRAQKFLDLVRSARRLESATAGSGRYSVLSELVIGGELESDGRLVHLSAFPERESRGGGSRVSDSPDAPIAPPSRRKRHMR
jgi:hypothetical protein